MLRPLDILEPPLPALVPILPRPHGTLDEARRRAEVARVRESVAAVVQPFQGRAVGNDPYRGQRESVPPRFAPRMQLLLRLHGEVKVDPHRTRSYASVHALRTRLDRLESAIRPYYPLTDPTAIDARHVLLALRWIEARARGAGDALAPARGLLAEDAISSAYAAQLVSALHTWLGWIGRPELGQLARDWVASPERLARTHVATRDKSWEAAGIDVQSAIERLGERERWVGLATMLQHAFGLRQREALMLQPLHDWRPDASGLLGTLFVRRGAKNGKHRSVEAWETWQGECVRLASDWLALAGRPGDCLPPHDPDRPGMGLAANLARYARVLAAEGYSGDALGVTGHGLRAGFAMRHSEWLGIVPPLRRSADRPPPGPSPQHAALTRRTSLVLGHGRVHATAFYVGAKDAHAAADTPAVSQRLDVDRLRRRWIDAGDGGRAAISDLATRRPGRRPVVRTPPIPDGARRCAAGADAKESPP